MERLFFVWYKNRQKITLKTSKVQCHKKTQKQNQIQDNSVIKSISTVQIPIYELQKNEKKKRRE